VGLDHLARFFFFANWREGEEMGWKLKYLAYWIVNRHARDGEFLVFSFPMLATGLGRVTTTAQMDVIVAAATQMDAPPAVNPRRPDQ
jgi:hypothetical protein